MRLASLAVLCLVVSAAPTLAQENGPNVSDPAGDAGFPAPAPIAWDWGDIVAVWIEQETAARAVVRIDVVAPETPPAGELAVRFASNGTHYIAGWTTVAFPAPPFVYQGGFLCTANEAFVADPADCRDFGGIEWTSNGLVIPIERALIGALDEGAVLGRIAAYSDQFAFDDVVLPVDRTEEGRDHVFTTGRGTAAAGPAPTGTAAPDTARPQTSAVADEPPARAPAEEASWSWLSLVVAFAVAAYGRARFTRSRC